MHNLAHALRFLSADAIEKANSGHPGLPLGMADVSTVLFQHILTFNPNDPAWPNRDRFVLSAGHGSMLLYSLLYLTGYEHPNLNDLKRFRQKDSLTPGHPELNHPKGIETTTGPLGQGFGNAVGMAIAEQNLRAKLGSDTINYHTFVLASDGDIMEGISHEAASLAGHLGLSNLIVLYDDNGITIDGKTDLALSDDTLARFKAYGWQTHVVDGHNQKDILSLLKRVKSNPGPHFIACKTTIGFGSPSKAGSEKSHGSPLGQDDLKAMRENLGWATTPFEVPEDVLIAWRSFHKRNLDAYQAWQRDTPQATRDILKKSAPISKQVIAALDNYKMEQLKLQKDHATRNCSQDIIKAITPALPYLIGGSADLAPSNNTMTGYSLAISPKHPDGNYIHYGIREHAMGAIVNGITLTHPYAAFGATFLTFSDYMRPSIRMAALMKIGSIFIFTHDSIGLGEDGPTHQPVEHIASLRAMPNLNVFRPCDAIEAAECWQIALEHTQTPSALLLTRQKLIPIRKDASHNLSAKGAYVIHDDADAEITLIATGSEVSLAMISLVDLHKKGIRARVVSMPCQELFLQQGKDYQDHVLGLKPRISIEAGSSMGWSRFVKNPDGILALDTYGASAPAEELFNTFGFTSAKVVELACKLLNIK